MGVIRGLVCGVELGVELEVELEVESEMLLSRWCDDGWEDLGVSERSEGGDEVETVDERGLEVEEGKGARSLGRRGGVSLGKGAASGKG